MYPKNAFFIIYNYDQIKVAKYRYTMGPKPSWVVTATNQVLVDKKPQLLYCLSSKQRRSPNFVIASFLAKITKWQRIQEFDA